MRDDRGGRALRIVGEDMERGPVTRLDRSRRGLGSIRVTAAVEFVKRRLGPRASDRIRRADPLLMGAAIAYNSPVRPRSTRRRVRRHVDLHRRGRRSGAPPTSTRPDRGVERSRPSSPTFLDRAASNSPRSWVEIEPRGDHHRYRPGSWPCGRGHGPSMRCRRPFAWRKASEDDPRLRQ